MSCLFHLYGLSPEKKSVFTESRLMRGLQTEGVGHKRPSRGGPLFTNHLRQRTSLTQRHLHADQEKCNRCYCCCQGKNIRQKQSKAKTRTIFALIVSQTCQRTCWRCFNYVAKRGYLCHHFNEKYSKLIIINRSRELNARNKTVALQSSSVLVGDRRAVYKNEYIVRQFFS